MNPNPPLIQMFGVTAVALRDADAVIASGVDWTVNAGDFWAVGGSAGSGKSDFLMLAAGLLAPQTGLCKIFGDDLPAFEEDRVQQRLRLGFAFDGGNLFNQLTVAENIALPLRYHRNLTAAEIAARVAELLALTELEPWADSTPGTLGRAWQKRAGLARALALQPELLLLDNPLGGADARHAAWWLDFLGRLATGERATTLVVTADDLQPWRGHARQFARLQDGHFEVVAKEMLADNDANR